MVTLSWLIIANGQLVSESLLQAIAKDKKVLVCDGAYNTLPSFIEPTILLGDFDSIDQDKLQQANHNSKLTIIKTPDQSKTDLEKAIDYLDSLGATDIVISNALGHRTDQTLHNLHLLKGKYKPHRQLYIIGNTEKIYFIENTTIELQGKTGDSVALLGLNQAVISTDGLKYDVVEKELKATVYGNISNELANNSATLSVKGQALLILSLNTIKVPSSSQA